jgi:putative phosphotransacetylase
MAQVFKPTSECADCRLCPHGNGAIPGNGALPIDRIVQEVVQRVRRQAASAGVQVPVGVSARHCHLNQEAMDILFGPGSTLTPYRDLYQPGAFAAEQMVSVVGPRLRAIERVRILGPGRNYNQVELARTDAIFLGLDPPVRDSGDLRGAQPITIIGPKGAITVNGAIRAARHLHLSPADVARMGLEGRASVRVRVEGEKGLVYANVRLKVDPAFLPEIHLDTDDANAADLACGSVAYIEV